MKTSALPPAGTLTGAELVAVVQGGASLKSTAQYIANLFRGTRGTSIASAATLDLSTATGGSLHVTGSTGPITSFGTADAGVERTLIFDSTPTLTHNAVSLILPGAANIVAAAGDVARAISEGSGNWRVASYTRASGAALVVAVMPADLVVALGDETTAITVGTAKVTMRAPRAMTLSAVKASLTTASSSGLPQFDVKKNGTTIFTTKPTIDASEKTTATAATASVLSVTSIAADDELTFDVVAAGTGAAGAKITLVATVP